MARKKTFLILLLSGFLVCNVVYADQLTIPNPLPSINNFWDLLARIADLLSSILFAAGPVALVIAAFYFLNAGGEPEKIKKAKTAVVYALTAVAVAVVAKGVVSWIQSVVK